MQLEAIVSVNPVIPTKGHNAGKQMFVINGKHWSKTEPTREHTHVVLEEVEKEGKKYLNVTGFSTDTRMNIQDKIKMITSHEAGYAQAIAFLLK
jgi:hypothetical protein